MFYVVEVQTLTDNTETKALFGSYTIDEAKQVYHSFLGANERSANLNGCMACIISDDGSVVMRESWRRE